MDKDLVMEFIEAAVENQAKAADMLKQTPALVNARYLHDETVLHFLCVEEYVEGVQFLLDKGAEVDAKNEFGDPALLDCVSLERTEIVKLLLKYGADANALSTTRGHVLHIAADNGNAEIVETLLQHGASIDFVDDTGRNVWDCVTKNQEKRVRVMQTLEAHIADRETF